MHRSHSKYLQAAANTSPSRSNSRFTRYILKAILTGGFLFFNRDGNSFLLYAYKVKAICVYQKY